MFIVNQIDVLMNNIALSLYLTININFNCIISTLNDFMLIVICASPLKMLKLVYMRITY